MGRLDGMRIAIPVAHEFEDIELMYPIIYFSEEGAQVTVATLNLDVPGHFHGRPVFPSKPVTGRFGHMVPLIVLEEGRRYRHANIDDLKAADFDAVVFPGGFSPDFLRTHDQTLDFIRDMHRAGKVVAAICHGPQVLISADRRRGTDTVRGRNVTSYVAVQDDMMNAGGTYHDVGAVREGNVVTGRCPDDLPEFCREVAAALEERKRAPALAASGDGHKKAKGGKKK
ncbi:MAG: type 1 glutamine amidotransferase [Anaerolineae bacterium]|nr:type 1 glutamine amidotransferase [Anaerolineae bacterium]